MKHAHRLLLTLAQLGACFVYLWASPIHLVNNQFIPVDHDQVSLFIDQEASRTFDQIKSMPFADYSEWRDQLKPNQVYWGSVELANDTESFTEWVIEFSLLLTDVQVFDENENAGNSIYRTGFFIPLAERDFAPVFKGNFVKIKCAPKRHKRIYFRAECGRKNMLPQFEMEISNSEYFFKKLSDKKHGQGMFMGFVLMMFVYNLFLFFYSSKDTAYIYYSIYLIGIIGYTAYNTGDLANYITPGFFADRPANASFSKIIVYIGMMGYYTFLRRFSDLKVLLPRWDRAFKWLTIVTACLPVLDIYLMIQSNFNFNTSDLITVNWSLFFTASIFLYSYYLLRTKTKNGYFIVLGIFCMGLGIILTMLNRFHSIDYSTAPFKIGVVLEIIIFSLGLAYRKRNMELENAHANFELEKNKLIIEQDEKEAARLKELDLLKAKLYTNITHEFRTPLTVIMGMNDNIQGYQKEKELIHRNSEHLLRLVNQMLDLSKIESNQLRANWVHGDMVSYLKYLTESIHTLANDKNIKLTFYSEAPEIWMDLDEDIIEQITFNLLSNAIKFTPNGGNIIFHIKEDRVNELPVLKIRIKDDGIGIHQDELPFIFDRFYQSKNNEEGVGTGIGLALVKELVELLHGEIKVESTFGRGSSFVIILPLYHKAEVALTPFTPKNGHQNVQFSIQNRRAVSPSEIDDTKPHLVLIEDHPDVAEYIQQILSKDYNIYKCFDGISGIEKVFEIIPDIIITDVMMPGKNGFEVTKILKNDERSSHIPVILLTARATQEDKLQGLDAGANAFLQKPFDKKELLIRIEKLHHERNLMVEKLKFQLNDHVENVNSHATMSLEEIFLDKISSYVEQNLSNPDLSVSELGEYMSLSHTQTYRKIKALTDLTPTLFIRTIRLKRALELLKAGEMNVAEVAFKVGFKDPNYFSRVFLMEFGITPSHV